MVYFFYVKLLLGNMLAVFIKTNIQFMTVNRITMIPWRRNSKRELTIVSISSQMPGNIFSASLLPWSTYFVSTQASIPPSLAIKWKLVGAAYSKPGKN